MRRRENNSDSEWEPPKRYKQSDNRLHEWNELRAEVKRKLRKRPRQLMFEKSNDSFIPRELDKKHSDSDSETSEIAKTSKIIS